MNNCFEMVKIHAEEMYSKVYKDRGAQTLFQAHDLFKYFNYSGCLFLKSTQWCYDLETFHPLLVLLIDDDVIKWKHFPRYWPRTQGIHRSAVNSPHKGQWRGALMFSLVCLWINDWVNTREAGDLWRYRAHYDVTVMLKRSYDVTVMSTTIIS